MVSDNGKTFKAAERAIRAITDHEDVYQYLSGAGIQWSFNLPRAPWWGGVFERMVRSTKRCLKKMVGQAKLSYDELLTVITEVEMIVNSRPLSYLSANDLEEPLTPSHLMIGRRVMSLPDHLSYTDEDPLEAEITPAHLSKRTKHLEKTLNHFWERWRKEYLLELRNSHRHAKGDPNPVPISVGDIVVIYREDKPRGFWKLGRVEREICGRDGRVRGAVVRTTNKRGHPITLERPIQQLYPLEINSNARTDDGLFTDVNTTEDQDSVEVTPAPNRPKRTAALEARDRLKGIALLDSDP